MCCVAVAISDADLVRIASVVAVQELDDGREEDAGNHHEDEHRHHQLHHAHATLAPPRGKYSTPTNATACPKPTPHPAHNTAHTRFAFPIHRHRSPVSFTRLTAWLLLWHHGTDHTISFQSAFTSSTVDVV